MAPFWKRRPFLVGQARLSVGELTDALLTLRDGEALTFDAHDRLRRQTWRETWTRDGDHFRFDGGTLLERDSDTVPATREDVEDTLEQFVQWLRW